MVKPKPDTHQGEPRTPQHLVTEVNVDACPRASKQPARPRQLLAVNLGECIRASEQLQLVTGMAGLRRQPRPEAQLPRRRPLAFPTAGGAASPCPPRTPARRALLFQTIARGTNSGDHDDDNGNNVDEPVHLTHARAGTSLRTQARATSAPERAGNLLSLHTGSSRPGNEAARPAPFRHSSHHRHGAQQQQQQKRARAPSSSLSPTAPPPAGRPLSDNNAVKRRKITINFEVTVEEEAEEERRQQGAGAQW